MRKICGSHGLSPSLQTPTFHKHHLPHGELVEPRIFYQQLAGSNPLHETIQHAFLSGLFEVDRQPIAFNGQDIAFSKSAMQYTVASFEIGRRHTDGVGDGFFVNSVTFNRARV